MAEQRWTFEWRRTWDEVFDAAFVARWDELRRADPLSSVYHRPAVVRAWAESCADVTGCEPLFGVAMAEGVTVLLPWVITTYRGRLISRRVIEAVGEDLFGYHDPMVAGPNAAAVSWDAFWAAVRSATASFGHQGFLRSVHADRAGGSGISADHAPILHLQGASSLDDLLSRCSGNHRSCIQRGFRRLAERGPVSLQTIESAAGHAAAATVFGDLCRVYEQRREERPEYTSLDRPGLRELWHRVATVGVAEGWGHLSTLSVGSEPIAWHLGLVDGGALYWWVPTHAREYQAVSPGRLLLASLVGLGIESGWHSVHFLTGAQQYKLAWRPEVAARYAVRWHAPTLVGSLLQRYDRRVAV